MKKIVSAVEGAKIKFRANGATVYLIDNKGILANDDHAQIMSERLGSQIVVSEPDKKSIADAAAAEQAAAEAAKLQEGEACKTDDGQEGTLQMNGEGQLVCTIPSDA